MSEDAAISSEFVFEWHKWFWDGYEEVENKHWVCHPCTLKTNDIIKKPTT